MHAAHQAGVVHRDLKPANILLQAIPHKDTKDRKDTKEEENGQPEGKRAFGPSRPLGPLCLGGDFFLPKITDFGLAKLCEADPQATGPEYPTASGAVFGTPRYMAPEQAWGRTDQVGPRTDVYALGAILYELLTGEPPFKGESRDATLEQVRTQEPLPPSRVDRKLPSRLETICLKCLEKAPEERYASAADLADDLRSFLNDEPIRARPLGWLGRLRRILRSQRWGAVDTWSAISLYAGLINCATYLGVYWLIQTGQSPWVGKLLAGTQALLLILVVWHHLRHCWPLGAVDRQTLAIFIGHGAALAMIVVLGAGTENEGTKQARLALFPYFAVITGMAYFILGSIVWGRFYVVGVAFFLLALLMRLGPEWAPLEFALSYGGGQVGIGFYLRSLARRKTAAVDS
jgi:hypothetical protein